MSWLTSTAFLQHCSLPPVHYAIPSAASPPPPLDEDTTATHASTCTPPSSTGFVLSRLINNGRTLELRWSLLASPPAETTDDDNPFSALDSSATTLPPVQFDFPSALLSSPSFHFLADSSLLVYCLAADGVLHSLTFPPRNLFYSPELDAGDYAEQLSLAGRGLEGRQLRALEGIDEGQFVISCEDGFNLLVEMSESGAILATRSLAAAPSSLRFIFSSRPSPPLLSIAHHPSYPQNLFGLTSTSLKLWSLSTGACQYSLALPESTKMIATPDGSSLVLWQEERAVFKVMGVSTDAKGEVVELVPRGEWNVREWKDEVARLVDMAIVTSKDGQSEELWSLWDTAGIPSLAFVPLSDTAFEEQWTVLPPSAHSASSTELIDSLPPTETTPAALAEHLYYPLRFPPSALPYEPQDQVDEVVVTKEVLAVADQERRRCLLPLALGSTPHGVVMLLFEGLGIPFHGPTTPTTDLESLWDFSSSSSSPSHVPKPLTLPSAALLIPAVSALIASRSNLAMDLFDSLESTPSDYPQKGFQHYLGRVKALLYSLDGVEWLLSRGVGEPKPEDDFEGRMGKMGLADHGDVDGQLSLAMQLLTANETPYAPAALDPLAFLERLACLADRERSHIVPATREEVLLTHWLVSNGRVAHAAAWCERWEEEGEEVGSGMRWVNGLVGAKLGRWDIVRDQWAKVAGTFYGTIALDSSDALTTLLPATVTDSKSFFAHCVTLCGVDAETVVFFAKRAEDLEAWFGGLLDLADWQGAYEVLMLMDGESAQAALSRLVTSLLASHQPGAAELLLSFSFGGGPLQHSLKKLLSFRARNADPLAVPNYSKVLYGHYVRRGDYRSAASIMFQHGRRLVGRQGPWREICTQQCQSYLAATNALALVDERHAWISLTADSSSSVGYKKRKLHFCVPEAEFDNAAPIPEVLGLKEVRQEYATALARLQLAETFPELERTTFGLDGDAVVSLFLHTGKVDEAFSAAATLEVGLEGLFDALTDSCVGLSLADGQEDPTWLALSDVASTWSGSTSSRAWRLLQVHLQRHDSAPYPYHRAVLSRTLAVGKGLPLPAWLKDFMRKVDVEALGRELVQFGREEEALELLTGLVVTNKPEAKIASSSLPYHLIDQLVVLDKPELKEKQGALRSAVSERIGEVQKVDGILAKRLRV